MRQVDERHTGLISGLVAVLCAVWLWVFLSPMEQLNLLVGVGSFLPVFIILVLAQWFPNRLVRLLAGLLAGVGYVAHYYAVPGLSFVGGLRELLHVEFQQVQTAIQGGGLADPLQTQLFLWGLCVMYWLIVYASRRTRLWMFYNILAVVVLGIVDGNTPVHPNFAIVTVLFVCVTVLGIHHYRRLQSNFASPSDGTYKFFGPLAGVIAFTLVVGWALPKQDAAWPDPIQWAKQVGSGRGSGSVQQVIGYQSDNERLGGSFVMNHDPVLSVVTKFPTYLRGQVYDIYTGKGWLPSSIASQVFYVGETFGNYVDPVHNIPTRRVTQTVAVLSPQLNVPVIFGAYQMNQVNQVSVAPNPALQVDQQTGSVLGPQLAAHETYQAVSNELQDPYLVLSKLPPISADPRTSAMNDEQAADLQLPSNLPPRIEQLARNITSSAKNEYETVADIRDYLQSEFTYDTQNIPVPGPQQDYVDQFLFDTKRGYCNNFSSTMAVMLRTLHIPARWVTGFATGSVDGTYSGPDMRYIYQNSDAHSWVEVYFPTVGWIPFDPTPNFSIPYLSDQSSSGGTGSSSGNSLHKPIQPDAKGSGDTTSTATGGLHIPWAALLHGLEWFLAILGALVAILAYVFRKQIRETRHRWVWKGNSPQTLLRALQHLVKTLRRFGDISKQPSTLRDLHPVAKSYGIPDDEYVHMIQTAESNWYGGVTPSEEDLDKVRGTWLRWILGILRR